LRVGVHVRAARQQRLHHPGLRLPRLEPRGGDQRGVVLRVARLRVGAGLDEQPRRAAPPAPRRHVQRRVAALAHRVLQLRRAALGLQQQLQLRRRLLLRAGEHLQQGGVGVRRPARRGEQREHELQAAAAHPATVHPPATRIVVSLLPAIRWSSLLG